MKYVAFDSHKRDTWAVVEDEHGGQTRGEDPHVRGALREFLQDCEPGSFPKQPRSWAAPSTPVTTTPPPLIPRGKEEELVRAMDRLVEESLR